MVDQIELAGLLNLITLREELAEEGIIVITVAYRLGVFGFYSHPQLDASNFAILDLIEAA